MFDWIRANETLLAWLGLASVVMFFGSLVVIPWLIVRIPSDYFAKHPPKKNSWSQCHPLVRIVLRVIKNLLGMLLLLAGIAMLILPGQGILAILLGLACLDFPGKRAAERWLIRRRSVLASVNWLRVKAGRQPIILPKDFIDSY